MVSFRCSEREPVVNELRAGMAGDLLSQAQSDLGSERTDLWVLDGARSLATSLPLNATLRALPIHQPFVCCAESFREHCSQRIKDSACAHSRVRPGAVVRGAHSFLRRKA